MKDQANKKGGQEKRSRARLPRVFTKLSRTPREDDDGKAGGGGAERLPEAAVSPNSASFGSSVSDSLV